jgi:hypothetical protein
VISEREYCYKAASKNNLTFKIGFMAVKHISKTANISQATFCPEMEIIKQEHTLKRIGSDKNKPLEVIDTIFGGDGTKEQSII